jgi:hypothetical protein
MNVILLTAFVGLALASFFIAFFVHQTNAESGAEQDALMPLDEEQPSQPKGASTSTKPNTRL